MAKAIAKHKAALVSASIDMDDKGIGYFLEKSTASNYKHFMSNNPLERILDEEIAKPITPVNKTIQEIADIVLSCTTKSLHRPPDFTIVQKIVKTKLKQNIEKQREQNASC